MDFEIGRGLFYIVLAVLMIPISAIVLGILSSIVKSIINSQERKLQMKLDAKNAVSGISDKALAELRSEIARLRDTTTEHAMSMQHAMERLERRVEFLECKSSTHTDRSEEPTRQRLGY